MTKQETKFPGFQLPEENWSKLPHQLIEALPKITSQGELMVVLYILRHTWGYREYGQFKKITLDEFMHGRKTSNLEDYPTGRMDGGVGMSKDAILRGLRRAKKHGFIEIEIDDSDKARIKKYYVLRMSESQTPDSDVRKPDPEVSEPDSQVGESDSNGTEVRQRSEKETLERNLEKETEKETVAIFPEKERTDDVQNETLLTTANGGREASEPGAIGPQSSAGAVLREVRQQAELPPPDEGQDHAPVGEVDPLMMDLDRATASARAASGNYAAPPPAGGDDGAAHAGLVALHEAKGGSPPKTGTGTYVKELEAISQALRDRAERTPEVAILAAQMFVEEKPKLACPHYKSFVGDYGEYLGRARGQLDGAPDRHARYDTPAVRASQAAWEERQAARPPPAEDDATGRQIKIELELQMTKATFDTWVKPVGFVCDDGVLTVTAPDAFAKDWLANRLAATIERTAVGVVGRAVEVRFEAEN